jgi:hypothetical protein
MKFLYPNKIGFRKPLSLNPFSQRRLSVINILLAILLLSCSPQQDTPKVTNWDKRIALQIPDSLLGGVSYLSVYSQIYSQTEHRTHDLTATISMRNLNLTDTIFINKAEYFNTEGKPIRTYFKKTVFVAPLETLEIVIDEKDQAGGTGGNFIFHWAIKPNTNEPLFEAVMISTSGQQGISFATQGKRIVPKQN